MDDALLNPKQGPVTSASGKDLIIEDLLRKLDAAHQKFDILSKATNDAIWDWDMVSGSVEWNHGLHKIYGYDGKADHHSRDVWENNLHPEDKDEVLRGFNQAIKQGHLNWDALYRYKCVNGIYKYTYDRGYIVYDGTQPVRMIGTMQDIDERMVALEEIEKLSMVASRTENLVIITDAEQKIEWVNEGFIKRTGYSLQEVVGKTPRILQGAETDKIVLRRIRRKIEARETVSEEVLNYTRGGDKFWIRLTINPVFDDHHKLIRLIAVETDITLHKDYENKITSIARELSDLIENANAIIFGVDRHGCVNEWNRQAIETTGYAKKDIAGQKLSNFVRGSKNKLRVDNYIQHVLLGNPMSLQEFEMITRNDENHIFILSATPRKNAAGEITGLMAVGQDITELTQYRKSLEEKVKERTQELQQALEKEKELASLKTRFASMVSHEFRTPLSAISISANHIKKYRQRMQPTDIDKKLETIQAQVSHMAHLLEDVLTIGKTEEGKIAIVRRKINVNDLVKKMKEEVENQFNNTHTIHETIQLTDGYIYSDDGLLRNIFINLLSNAIKFSPGKDAVFLTVHEKEESVVFEIRDEGIGIPEVDLKGVFEPFARGTNVSTISGTGLGLSIVRKATDLLGGTISLTSKAGEGSVFSVTIPLH